MTKLGSEWHVPQKSAGQKRPPEIAADLEREFLAFAERLWNTKIPSSSTRSAVKPLPDTGVAMYLGHRMGE